MGKEGLEKQEKKERRFSQEQYKMRLRCSEKGHEAIKEWNEWREEMFTLWRAY